MIALALLFALIVYGVLAWSAIRALGWLGRVCVFSLSSTRVWQGITLAVFVLLPTWDIIPGRLYFQHLCQTEAGIRVFRTVEVDQSFFRPDGTPDENKLSRKYVQTSSFERSFSKRFNIAKTEGVLQELETGDKLGISTDFFYHGGWLMAVITPGGAGTSCQIDPKFGIHTSIWGKVIKPEPRHFEGKY